MIRPTDAQIMRHLLKYIEAQGRLLAYYRAGAVGSPGEATFKTLEKKIYGKTPLEWARQRIKE